MPEKTPLRLTTLDAEAEQARDWLLDNIQMEFPDAVFLSDQEEEDFYRSVYAATRAYRALLRLAQDISKTHNTFQARASDRGTVQIQEDPLDSDVVMLRIGIIVESEDLSGETNGDEQLSDTEA